MLKLLLSKLIWSERLLLQGMLLLLIDKLLVLNLSLKEELLLQLLLLLLRMG